jgi:hypothetical protein
MSTRAKAKRSAKYDLCCLSVMPTSYPAAPYRVYIADSTNRVVVGRYEAGAFASRAEAERWLKRHCRYWMLCNSP